VRDGNADKRRREEKFKGRFGHQKRAKSAPPRVEPEEKHYERKREALDKLIGRTGQGVSVTLERAIAALGAFYFDKPTDRLPPMFTGLAVADRVALAAAVSGLSAKTVRWLVKDFEDTESIMLEEGVRGAAAEAYLRWARPPEGSKGKAARVLRGPAGQHYHARLDHAPRRAAVVQGRVRAGLLQVGKILKAWGFKYGKLTRPPRGENIAAPPKEDLRAAAGRGAEARGHPPVHATQRTAST
jgi:hypothetical protein